MALITGPISTELGEPKDLSPAGIRDYLKAQHQLLADAFNNGIFIDYLLGGRAMVMDRLLSCLLYTSPSPRDRTRSRMPSSA